MQIPNLRRRVMNVEERSRQQYGSPKKHSSTPSLSATAAVDVSAALSLTEHGSGNVAESASTDLTYGNL